jgi:predicted nucleic acid-binding protein
LASLTFIDTNVLAYAYDGDSPAKREIARRVLNDLGGAVISTQVLLELYAVLTRKLGLPQETAYQAVDALMDLEVVPTDERLVSDGLRLSVDSNISHWDALIVVAASRAGCDTLLTEDLSHGQVIEGVRIVNPFAADRP